MGSSYDATKTKDEKKKEELESSSSTSSCTTLDDEKRQHFQSSLALCFSVFLTFYTNLNVFPYLGFMVLQLVNGLNKETVGVRVGFLASSFMLGRTLTSYGWGRIADIYGRKFVLILSLLLLGIGSIGFGCATSYGMAIVIRFVMGLGNGTMIVAKTSISELAKGNDELETKGVGILMSMGGFSLLLCPAIGGLLAEPIQQYFPHLLSENNNMSGGFLFLLLVKFPFLLPNLLAGMLSLISIVLVNIYVEETLPVEQRRHWSHLGTDTIQYLFGCFRTTKNKELANKPSALTASSSSASSSSSLLTTTAEAEEDPPSSTATETTPLVTSTSSSSLQHQKDDQNNNGNNNQSIIRTIWNQNDTRSYLISAWCNHFASICYSEAFPLFAMSVVGGLGLEEKFIGLVGTFAGLIYCLGQYKIFRYVIAKWGVIQGMKYASGIAAIPFGLMPLSLWFPNKSMVQIGYLAIVMAMQSIARSIFMGGNTIQCNRTVEAQNRAAMNGISSTGVGLARGLGPIFTGWLMAFCLSHPNILPPQSSAAEDGSGGGGGGGGWVAYGVLTVIALMAYLSTGLIVNDDMDDDNDGGKKGDKK